VHVEDAVEVVGVRGVDEVVDFLPMEKVDEGAAAGFRAVAMASPKKGV